MLTDLTLAQARDGLRRRDFSALELTDAYLAAIEALNPKLNAYVLVTGEAARAQAKVADAALAAGTHAPLTGIPLAIKDLFCTLGVRTTAGSRILEPFIPPYESTVTANLLRDGAIFLGKANMDEFAMGSSNMTSAFGPVASPWTRAGDNRPLVPGGSSGGSAAEASSNLARYDGVRFGARTSGDDLAELYENTRAEGFGAEVKRRVLIGTYVLSAGYYDAYYLKAQKVRALILKDFTDVFQKVDALVTPTAPSAAFAQGEKMDDPITMYLNDVFTVPANMSGIPGLSVPAGLDGQGLPLGLQVLGRPFDEETVFAVGAALERAAGFSALPGIRAGV